MSVDVAVFVEVDVKVRVGKMIDTGVSVAVAVARGVRVIPTFGTHKVCPTTMLYRYEGMQLANCSWEIVVAYAWLMLNKVLPACTV